MFESFDKSPGKRKHELLNPDDLVAHYHLVQNRIKQFRDLGGEEGSAGLEKEIEDAFAELEKYGRELDIRGIARPTLEEREQGRREPVDNFKTEENQE